MPASSVARQYGVEYQTEGERNDLLALWCHAWAYADAFPSNDADTADAYATWYATEYGERFLRDGDTPEHPSVYHGWASA